MEKAHGQPYITYTPSIEIGERNATKQLLQVICIEAALNYSISANSLACTMNNSRLIKEVSLKVS